MHDKEQGTLLMLRLIGVKSSRSAIGFYLLLASIKPEHNNKKKRKKKDNIMPFMLSPSTFHYISMDRLATSTTLCTRIQSELGFLSWNQTTDGEAGIRQRHHTLLWRSMQWHAR